MYLTEISHLPSFSPFRAVSKRPNPSNFDLISRSFDENVNRRLKSLNSSSNPPSISLSWLSLAFDFLAATNAEAQTLISNLRSSSGSSDDSLALYLDHSVKLLDICNSILSEIESLRQRRLLINFVLHLLQVTGDDRQIPAPEKLRRGRDSLVDWENNSRGFAKRRAIQIHDPEVLVRDLRAGLGSAPRGKISSVKMVVSRTIYAVGLFTVFVAGISVSALYGLPEIVTVQAPGEFLWAASFNQIESAIREGLKRRFLEGERKGLIGEIDDVATRVIGARDAIDGILSGDTDDDEVKKERLERAVKALRTVTERFSEGLDGLCNGVNGVFQAVLCTRNAMLENFRVGHEKPPKN